MRTLCIHTLPLCVQDVPLVLWLVLPFTSLSLTHTFLPVSLFLCALCLGWHDIQAGTGLPMRLFEYNRTFHAIDMNMVLAEQSQCVRDGSLVELLRAGIEKGVVR